ncbi:hypothetical protein ACVWZX_003969 [Deinococcus sp. UYEF24]
MTSAETPSTRNTVLWSVLGGVTLSIGLFLCAKAQYNVLLDKQLDIYLTNPPSRWNVLLVPAGEVMVIVGVLLLVATCIAEHKHRKTELTAVRPLSPTLDRVSDDTTIYTSVNNHIFVVVETTRDEHHPSVAREFDLASARLRSKRCQHVVNIKGAAPTNSTQVRLSDTSTGTVTVVYGTLRDVQAEIQGQDVMLTDLERNRPTQGGSRFLGTAWQ